MRRLLSVSAGVAIALVISAAGGISLADTINVPADYGTLQAAIAAASSGDTIAIASGTYIETGQIVIDKNLTITGAGMGSTILNKAEDSGNTSSGNDAPA